MPTHNAPTSRSATPARPIAVRAASIAMVITSSSPAGTDFSATGGAAPPPAFHTAAMSAVATRGRGTQAP